MPEIKFSTNDANVIRAFADFAQEHNLLIPASTEPATRPSRAGAKAETSPAVPEGEKVPGFIGKDKDKKAATKPAAEKPAETKASKEDRYRPVKEATLALVKINRDLATGLLEEFGVGKADQIPEDQWAEYVKKAQVILDNNAKKEEELV